MLHIERVQPDPSDPRAVRRAQVEAILAVIPPRQLRDRLFFRLLVETGLRVSEALGVLAACLIRRGSHSGYQEIRHSRLDYVSS